MQTNLETQRVPTVVVGGGQAGLAVGYHLARRGMRFVILDANQRAGDAWRNRWDSLRLFTPARYSALPGLPFPAPGGSFPGKEQVADYLESYAKRFRLPLRTGTRVERVSRRGDGFLVAAGRERFEAANVVVAMSNYQKPRVPAFAGALDPGIRQIHASAYRNPAQLEEGRVLVVGVGNSGADIAIEVAKNHPTLLAGKESGHIPFPIHTFLWRQVLVRLMRFLGHHVLTIATPIGRKLRPKMLHRTAPLIRVKPQDLLAAGVERVPRVAGVQGGRPVLADGRVLEVKNVLWCTGYTAGFSWIDLPVFGEDGEPVHDRGVSRAPGLFFVGLHYQYAMTSATLLGVGRDAERIVAEIARRDAAGAQAA